MKPFKIWCETEEIRDKVLAKMETEGILWSTGKKPTILSPLVPLWLCVDESVLTWVFKDFETKHPEITPEEYLREKTGGTEMKKFIKPFKITCYSDEIRDKVLAKMENDGILWISGEKPTKESYPTPLILIVDEDATLGYASKYATMYYGSEYPEITPEEYLERKIDFDENNKRGTEIKKSYLKTGYIVTTRNGEEYMVFSNMDLYGFNAKSVIVGKSNYELLCDYTEDLLHTNCPSGELDIVKVEKAPHPNCLLNIEYLKSKRQLLWERKEEPKEMTIEELEKLLGYPVKIVK